jgi:hypothetical protein
MQHVRGEFNFFVKSARWLRVFFTWHNMPSSIRLASMPFNAS